MDRRQDQERNLEKELQSHLDLEAEELRAAGLSDADARFRARRTLGSEMRIKESVRDVWGWNAPERLWQDLNYAIRILLRSPGFTLITVLSLAMGIGANTAIFTFVNAALLKPLPYPESDRIVALQERQPKTNDLTSVHPRSFVEWHERSRSFQALAILQRLPFNTDGTDGAEQIPGMWATSELFQVFGTRPALGRVFTDAEARPGATPVAILSHAYWQRRFGSDKYIAGKTIRLQRKSTTILGVMPAGFRIGTTDSDIYVPLPLDSNRPEAVGSRAFEAYGRLRPGITINAARAEMSVIAGQLSHEFRIDEGWGVSVVTLRDRLIQGSQRVLLLLLSAVALVLLIACANVAGLVLTRGVGRRSEFGLRASLGANRSRLIQQLLVENIVLSLAGGVVGLMIGIWMSKALVVLATNAVAFGQMSAVGLDGRVLAFTIGVSALTGIVFGVVPALQLSKFDLSGTLRESGRGSGHQRQKRFRSALVVAEISLAVVLLVGAGLLVRTLSRMLSVNPGFQPDRVLTMKTFVMGEAANRSNIIEAMRDRMTALPGVLAAGTIQFLPLSGMTNRGPFHLPNSANETLAANNEVDTAVVSQGYFSAMGIPLLRGRTLAPEDRFGSKRVVLVSQSFANKFFPREDPVGHMAVGDWSTTEPAEIVGVVGDVRHDALTAEPRPMFYLAQTQSPGYLTYLVVRTHATPESLIPAIRREIRDVLPGQPMTDAKPMAYYVAATVARPQLYAFLVASFSALALVLAAIGLYGLISYSVSQRTQEIGIRMALGAQSGAVLRSIVGQGSRLALLGLVLGIAGAILMSRFLASFLYGVRANDVTTYASVSVVLGAVALVASYIPARKAACICPVDALRHQ